MPRLLARAATAGAYTTAKSAAQSGTIAGIAVTLRASDDTSRHLVLDVGTVANASRLVALAEASQVSVLSYQMAPESTAEAYARDPWAFVAGWLAAGGGP